MNKKAMIIAGAAVLALTVAGVTMASPMGMGMMGGGLRMGAGPMAIQAQQLSESQQAEWKAIQEKKLPVEKRTGSIDGENRLPDARTS